MSRFGKSGDDSFSGLDPFASVPDVDERLADWVDGTMSQRDRDRFEAEMRVSPHLREQVADYQATVASIREALNDETHETDLADRVMASLAQEASGAGRPTRSRWPFVWAVMSAAALLGVAVLIDSWGGSMLTPKTRTGTAAHDSVGASAADSKGAAAGLANSGDEQLAGGRQAGGGQPAVGRPGSSMTAPGTPLSSTPGFDRSKSGAAENKPADKHAASAESNQLPSPEAVAAGRARGGREQPLTAELVENLEEAEASKLAKKMRSASGEAEGDRSLHEMSEGGRAAAPNASAPNAGGPEAVVPKGVAIKPRLVRPAGPGPLTLGPTGPRAGGPATGGPATGGPASPASPGPGTPGPGTSGPGTSGPGTGGPAGPAAGAPGTGSRGAGRGGRRARGGSRNPAAHPRGGAPLPGAASTPTPITGTPVEESTKPKAVRSPEDATPSAADKSVADKLAADGGRDLDPNTADSKRRKSGDFAAGSDGRALTQRPKNVPREYLVRLSEQKSVGEILPLVIVDGYAVPSAAVHGLVAGGDPARTPKTGSDDFYLGSTRKASQPDLRPFFDLQMRPRDTSSESRAEFERGAKDGAKLGAVVPGAVAPGAVAPGAVAPGAVAPGAVAPDAFSIGGLQLFAVGPSAPTEKEEQGKVREAETKSQPQAKKGDPKLAIPGEWDAHGGAHQQRDWLVVGPRSEVAKLLVALRKYSDDVVTRTCRTGEVRLVNSESKLDDGARERGRDSAVRASEPRPSTVPVPLGSGGGNAGGNAPKRSANPSEAAQAEPTQRVVIRFRVRR